MSTDKPLPAEFIAVTPRKLPRKPTPPSLAQLKDDLGVMIAWYRSQKPDVKRVIVSEAAWDRIRISADAFAWINGKPHFDGFELVRETDITERTA